MSDAELLSDGSLRKAHHRADCQNLIAGESGLPVGRAVITDARLPPLGHHIGCVVGTRSQEKMLGVYAGSVVATMQNTGIAAIRDWAAVDFVGNSMGSAGTAIVADLAISATKNAAGPIPATSMVVDGDLRSETFEYIYSAGGH